MGIWERLSNVVKSYINDSDRGTKWRGAYETRSHDFNDSDYEAAYEELDDFLRGGGKTEEKTENSEKPRKPAVSAQLARDFAALGLTPGASAKECKAAYKKILKIHHPDRHTGNQAALKKATEKTALVNAAYARIEEWFKISS